MQVDLEIVSPERLLLSKPVDMVVIPAAEGELFRITTTVTQDGKAEGWPVPPRVR